MSDDDITLEDLLEELENDERYQELSAKKDAELAAVAAVRTEDERELVAQLQAIGLKIESVWDLLKWPTPYPEAIEILAEHLGAGHEDNNRQAIARVLTVSDGIKAWDTLISEFPKGDATSSLSSKWAIGNAIYALVNHHKIKDISEIEPLVLDQRHGEARGALVDALACIRTDEAWAVLEKLKDDPTISERVRAALKKCR